MSEPGAEIDALAKRAREGSRFYRHLAGPSQTLASIADDLDTLACPPQIAEWGLIVITRDGKTLLPEHEICTTREQAEERARQERSFGMTCIVASRQVTKWEPVASDG